MSDEYENTKVNNDSSYERVDNDIGGTMEDIDQSNTEYEDIQSSNILSDLSNVQNMNSEHDYDGNDDEYMEPANARNPTYQALGHREVEMKTPYAVLDQNSFKSLSSTDTGHI